MDEPTFVGCLVLARLIGVIEVEQTEHGQTTRNDHLLAVAVQARNHQDVQSLEQLSDNLVVEIEHFCVSYLGIKGKTFTPRGQFGVEHAKHVVAAGIARGGRA